MAGAACLIALELTLRFAVGLGDPVLARLDETVEYLPLPGDYRRFGNRTRINAQGLRAPDLAATGPAARLLVLGDSVIYGNHFIDQSDIVTAHLTARDACDLPVLPIAASSWGPVNQAAYLAAQGTFGARAALIVLSAHDLFDIPTRSGRVAPYRLRPSLTATGDALRAVRERHPPPAPADFPNAETRAEMTLDALDRMLGQMRGDGMRVALVYHPTLPEWDAGARPAAGHFAAWAADRRVPFVSLLDTMARPGPGAYRDAIHPAPDGARAVADALWDIAEPLLPVCEIASEKRGG